MRTISDFEKTIATEAAEAVTYGDMTEEAADEAKTASIFDFSAEGRFYSRVFTVFFEPRIGNWIVALFKDTGEPWRLVSRFRWYRGSKIFDSDDEKRVMAGVAPSGIAKPDLIRQIRTAANVVAEKGAEQFNIARPLVHELVLETNDQRQILRQLSREKGFHLRVGKVTR